MRRKVIISAISAIAVAAIVGALVVKHRFPFEAASARTPPVVPTVPVVAGTVSSSAPPAATSCVGRATHEYHPARARARRRDR